MNIKLITKWLENLNWELSPPGSISDITESPIDPERLAVQIGVLYEHRFAFFYWARFYQEYILKNKYKFPISPILVSLDYHNDVGADSDFLTSDLDRLNLKNRTELNLFCWSYLNPLNDGQILPALYLNLFSDVLILTTNSYLDQYRSFKDRYSNKHEIHYFNQIESLTKFIDSKDTPIYLDIDLDYFTEYPNDAKILGSSKMCNLDSIKKVMSLKGPLMSKIYPKIVGLTIALEPEHCGGVNQSFKILRILNLEFFNNTLFTNSCKWKY